jgi:hypothetical protein
MAERKADQRQGIKVNDIKSEERALKTRFERYDPIGCRADRRISMIITSPVFNLEEC